MYVAYSLKSVVGLLYELLLSCFIPVVNALPKLQESGMFIFLNQLLIFLVLFIVDATVFVLLWVGHGVIAFNSLSEFVLQKLMKAVGIQRNSWKTSVARLFDRVF